MAEGGEAAGRTHDVHRAHPVSDSVFRQVDKLVHRMYQEAAKGSPSEEEREPTSEEKSVQAEYQAAKLLVDGRLKDRIKQKRVRPRGGRERERDGQGDVGEGQNEVRTSGETQEKEEGTGTGREERDNTSGGSAKEGEEEEQDVGELELHLLRRLTRSAWRPRRGSCCSTAWSTAWQGLCSWRTATVRVKRD